MDKVFSLSIISADKVIYKGSIFSLVVPAKLGYLGVLANHAPFVSLLAPGKASFKEASGQAKTVILESSGFLEILNNQATLLLG